MAGREIEIGPIGKLVGAAVGVMRRQRRMTLIELSEKLRELERPIGPNSLARLERGERRVDVDDLVCLAKCLGVPPAHLLEGWVDMSGPGDATVTGQVRASANVSAFASPAEVGGAAGDAVALSAEGPAAKARREALGRVEATRKALESDLAALERERARMEQAGSNTATFDRLVEAFRRAGVGDPSVAAQSVVDAALGTALEVASAGADRAVLEERTEVEKREDES